MNKSVTTGTNRLPNGKFAKGNCANPNGRPKAPEVEELRQALRIARKKNGNKGFLLHFVERAYKNDKVAVALAKKIIPDKIAADIKGEGFGDKSLIIFVNGNNTEAKRFFKRITGKEV